MTSTVSHRRVLTASLVGTAVEFYDFYIYATAAALVFGPLFFPSDEPGLQLLLSYASFSVAFFARPLGAIAFGHFGDRVGRKSTLVASLLIMGLSTFLIAFLPSYAVIGWVAPALLCVLRFGQGFGLGFDLLVDADVLGDVGCKLHNPDDIAFEVKDGVVTGLQPDGAAILA